MQKITAAGGKGMIGMATKEYIRKMHFVEGESIRWIVREIGHSRQYIRKVICEEVPIIRKYTLTKVKEKPVMGPYLDIIFSWLQEDENRPKKQRTMPPGYMNAYVKNTVLPTVNQLSGTVLGKLNSY